MSIGSQSFSVFKRDAFLYGTRILTSAVIARQLGPEMLGIAVILQMIPSYAEGFARLKVDVAAVYFLGKAKYPMEEVIFLINSIAVLTSGIVIGLIFWNFDWLYGMLFSATDFDAASLMLLMLAQIPLQFLYMNYLYLLLHKEQVGAYNIMVIINALVSSVLAAILLLTTDLGLWALIGSVVSGTFLALVFAVFRVGSLGFSGMRFNAPLIRDLLQYGSKLYAGGLVSHLQIYVTNALVVLLLAPAQVAFFSMAQTFTQIIDRVPAALNTIMFPRLTKTMDPEECARLAARASRMIFAVLSSVAVAAATLIYPAAYVLYGVEYLPLALPFIILLPGIVMVGAASPFLSYYLSINRPGIGILLPLPSLLVQGAFALFLIPLFGPPGAALSLSGGLIFLAAINATVFLWLSKRSFRADLLLQGEDIRYLWNFFLGEAGRATKFLKLERLRRPHA